LFRPFRAQFAPVRHRREYLEHWPELTSPSLMSMRVVRLARRPAAMPEPGVDLVLDENAPMPKETDLQKGQVLVKNDLLTMDPAMRGWMRAQKSYIPPVEIGAVMRGSSLGTVIASKSEKYKAGDKVSCGLSIGWAEYGIAQEKELQHIGQVAGQPLGVHLGALGGTGITAYIGLLEVGKPKPGETVVVSAAAGATGSVVCQIAKNVFGCRVVGIAGGPEKCKMLVDEFGLDGAIDYKYANGKEFRKDLRKACPNGVDVFFDNVGGWILEDTLKHINQKARIVICGAIAGYNSTKLQPGPGSYLNLINTSSRMEGFVLFHYLDKMPQAQRDLKKWLEEGKIQHIEENVTGLENAPRALLKLFGGDGGNKGRIIVDIHGKKSNL